MNAKQISKTTLIGLIELLEKNLSRILETCAPEPAQEKIICKTYRGATRFYLRNTDGKEKYLSADKEQIIREYSQNRYIAEIKTAAKKEIDQLRACLKLLRNENKDISDINEVFSSFPDALKPYIEPVSISDEKYAEEWQEGNVVVKHKRIHAQDDYHKYKTMRGDYVGSKSEAIIADRLFANGIPYHYEVAFIPESKGDRSRPVYDEYGRIVGYEAPGFDPFARDTLHPDFYVLNKRTRKAYFWEHLGKLQDPKYCTENLNRIVRMIDAGYTIGEEILITHEDSYNPLRLESIDGIIDMYLK